MININIEIKKRNRSKEFFQKIHSILENILFSIVMKLPEKFIPSCIMNWLEQYTEKRLNALKQETIKQTWRNHTLQTAVDSIKEKSNQ